ncbi:RHS repeat-associated core domain-containing protein [Agromyces aerolatus]|uniref:RHS repeat-associated core domain-containing protein n=1 Tax=Agromyces sp. LY-1074 TaxID=3074080 RepID=UPI00285441A9|nr:MULTISPECIES: RHS repeat-associated core domain-containing protein [unclassified Agromyces]MDR5701377.1 RHS repeat-associated core domain-containing protein [Agromyces sp. LY-1074]MDR5706834.1 RHS repeat-associated core domain-containing protein [Agromyces sp. LY-1358]
MVVQVMRHGARSVALGAVVCAAVVGGVVSPSWAADPAEGGEALPAGGFAVGDGVEAAVGEASGAVSFVLPAGGIGLAWSSQLAGVDRFGLGEAWSIAGVGFVDVRGGVRVFPSRGEVFAADATAPSGLSGYPMTDLRFEQVPGELPGRADGLVGARQFAFRLLELGGTVSYFDADGDPIAREDRFGNRVDWTWAAGDAHRLTSVVTEVGVVTELDWSDPGRVEVATRAGAGRHASSVELAGGRVGGVVDAVGGRTSVGYAPDGMVSRLSGVSGAVTEFAWQSLADGRSAVDRVRVVDAVSAEVLSERTWQPVEGFASGWPDMPEPAAAVGAASGQVAYSSALSDGATRVVSEYSDRGALTGRTVLVGDASGERVVQEQTYTFPDDGAEEPADRPTGATIRHANAAGESRVADEGFRYDELGRQVSGHDGTRYAYDAQNRAIEELSPAGEAIRTSYWATGQRRQLAATDPGTGAERATRFYWDGTALLADTHTPDTGAADPGDWAAGSYLIGAMRHARTIAGGTAYSGHDRHGNVSDLTDGGGAVTERYAYDDYGLGVRPQGDPEASAALLVGDVTYQPFRYAGEYTNPTGTQHLQIRSYDPETRRFQQRDPADQHNRYWFGDANPITHVDPSGRTAKVDWLTISLAGVGLALSLIGLGAAAYATTLAMSVLPGMAGGAIMTATDVALGLATIAAVADTAVATALTVDAVKPEFMDDDLALGLGAGSAVLGGVGLAAGAVAGALARGVERAERAIAGRIAGLENPLPQTKVNSGMTLAQARTKYTRIHELTGWMVMHNADGSPKYWNAVRKNTWGEVGTLTFSSSDAPTQKSVMAAELMPENGRAMNIVLYEVNPDTVYVRNPWYVGAADPTEPEFLTQRTEVFERYLQERGIKVLQVQAIGGDGIADGSYIHIVYLDPPQKVVDVFEAQARGTPGPF